VIPRTSLRLARAPRRLAFVAGRGADTSISTTAFPLPAAITALLGWPPHRVRPRGLLPLVPRSRRSAGGWGDPYHHGLPSGSALLASRLGWLQSLRVVDEGRRVALLLGDLSQFLKSRTVIASRPRPAEALSDQLTSLCLGDPGRHVLDGVGVLGAHPSVDCLAGSFVLVGPSQVLFQGTFRPEQPLLTPDLFHGARSDEAPADCHMEGQPVSEDPIDPRLDCCRSLPGTTACDDAYSQDAAIRRVARTSSALEPGLRRQQFRGRSATTFTPFYRALQVAKDPGSQQRLLSTGVEGHEGEVLYPHAITAQGGGYLQLRVPLAAGVHTQRVSHLEPFLAHWGLLPLGLGIASVVDGSLRRCPRLSVPLFHLPLTGHLPDLFTTGLILRTPFRLEGFCVGPIASRSLRTTGRSGFQIRREWTFISPRWWHDPGLSAITRARINLHAIIVSRPRVTGLRKRVRHQRGGLGLPPRSLPLLLLLHFRRGRAAIRRRTRGHQRGTFPSNGCALIVSHQVHGLSPRLVVARAPLRVTGPGRRVPPSQGVLRVVLLRVSGGLPPRRRRRGGLLPRLL